MKFTISSQVLNNKLQFLSKVINTKAINPLLQDFFFKTEGNILTIIAADNDTTLEATIELVECDMDSQIAFPAKTMLDSVREIPDQPITFEINDTTYETVVYYCNGRYNIVGHNADEYPQPSMLQDECFTHTIPSAVFANGISRSIFAAADDELRPVMNGVYIIFDKENTSFVTSDGHKLVCDKNASYTTEEKSSFILPKRPATIVKSFIGSSDEVTISFDNRIAVISNPDYRLTCRLIEGRYPNYASVIPTNNPHKLTLDRPTFISALKRVAVFSPAESGLIRLRINEGELVMSAQNLDFSTSAVESMACQYEGVPMSIGFKANFLIEVLNNTPGQEIILKLADPSRAGLIVPSEQDENDNLVMLLMPMVVND